MLVAQVFSRCRRGDKASIIMIQYRYCGGYCHTAGSDPRFRSKGNPGRDLLHTLDTTIEESLHETSIQITVKLYKETLLKEREQKWPASSNVY